MVPQPCPPRTSRLKVTHGRGRDRSSGFRGPLRALSAVSLTARPSRTSEGYYNRIITFWAPVGQTNSWPASIDVITSTLKDIGKWGSEKLGNLPDIMAGRIVAGVELTFICSSHSAMRVPPKSVILDQRAGSTAERGERKHLRRGHLLPTCWIANTYHGTLPRLD